MKISDFKTAEYFIRQICYQQNQGFVDANIEFVEYETDSGFEDNTIYILNTDKWNKTIFSIIYNYIANFTQITGSISPLLNEEKIYMANSIMTILRDLSYDEFNFAESLISENTLTSLKREPIVWLILRDIICPAFEKPLKNIKIINVNSGQFDVAHYIKDSTSNIDGPFIIVNNSIENKPVKIAHLLHCSLIHIGLDPKTIITKLLSESELTKPFNGIIQMAFNHRTDFNNFYTTLGMLINYKEIESVMEQKASTKWNGKTGLWSQAQYDPAGWWYLGLLEKSLESARGSDWTGYFTLKTINDDLYRKIDEEKKRRGLPSLPLETLLRIQSEEFKQDSNLIMQGLLADNRVW
jgi:hypothetical protein